MTQPPPEPFEAHFEDRQDGTLVRLSGELDFACAQEVASALDEAANRDGAVELDLSAVTFLDSSALQALVAARRRADRDGAVVVVGAVSDPVRRVLEITRTLDWLCERNGSSGPGRHG